MTTMKAIHTEKCLHMNGSPVMYLDMLNNPARSKFDLSSLKSIVLGASAVSKPFLKSLKDGFNLEHVLIGYVIVEHFKIDSIS